MKGTARLISILVLLVTGCVDPISFETQAEEGQLVFFGIFSQLEQIHTFSITETTEFNKQATPVQGAEVVLWDDQGNSAAYREMPEGIYELPEAEMPGVPGRAYHIEITLNNGDSYQSPPQVMPEPVEIDSLYFEFETREVLSDSGIPIDRTFVNILLSTPLTNICGEPSNLRWVVEEIYSFVDRSCGTFDTAETCYFIEPVDESEVLLFENSGTTQENLERLPVRSREMVPYDQFTARHYFIVHQYAISDDELQYWDNIDAVANQTGSLFDVQPARVVGNIFKSDDPNEVTLGYFGVSGESNKRTFITPFDIRPNPVFTCMDESFFRDNPLICCFCVNKPGIQIGRPAFWDED